MDSARQTNGAIAQLGERYNGIVEVSGSIPLSSTKLFNWLTLNRVNPAFILPETFDFSGQLRAVLRSLCRCGLTWLETASDITGCSGAAQTVA